VNILTSTKRVRAIKRGSTIGVFSPSEPVVAKRQDGFQRGLTILSEKGFSTKLSKHCLSWSAYTAGTVDDRLEDIHSLISDPEVHALMASWGGKSCNQLLGRLDYKRIASARKPIFAFSDGGVLLNAITSRTGMITFYGPNVVGKLHETNHADLSITTAEFLWRDRNLLGESSSRSAQTIRSGKAQGRLFGGNLSTFVLGVVCSDIPRDYWKKGIFFLEEPSMPPQILDQYLTSLGNIGFFDQISGLVVGLFECNEPIDWKRADAFSALKGALSRYSFPILYCPTFGHAALENPILPIGALCTLDADKMHLFLNDEIVMS
jgi:muramoyltetrapeptide carboxypeptidase